MPVYTKSPNVDDHLREVGLVLDQLHEYGIKVKASKLQIGLREIPFLGVILQETGIIPNKLKTKAINDIPPPATIGQLRRTMGMFAYYRKLSRTSVRLRHRCFTVTQEKESRTSEGRTKS